MPGSFVVFESLARQIIEWSAPARALDIGPGAGKYGRMLQQLVPGCRRVAVEAEPSYVDRFELRALYDEVHVATAAAWQASALDASFDLAILGDCIEHMPKSVGQDLLNFLVYRCAYVLVVAPEFLVQGAFEGVSSEAHVSVWSERDLHWHDLWAWDNCRAVGVYVLRGYQPSALSLAELVRRVNESNIPVHEFHDPNTLVRPARLRLVEHPREISYRVA